MAKALVVVESPAKAKTINKYLGRDYKVVASMGHIRDLPKSKLGVDVDDDFAETYESIAVAQEGHQGAEGRREGRDRHLRRDRPRPRRRGDRLAPRRRSSSGKKRKIHRLTFNEITKKAVQEALKHPRADRREDGRRAAGAPRARSAGRLQDQPAALGQGPPRPERRPRAVGGAEADLRSRARDRSVRPGGVLEHLFARLAGPQPPEFEAKLLKKSGETIKVGNEEQSKAVLADLERRARGSSRRSRRRSASATRRRRSSRASCSRRRASRSRRR